MTWLRLKRPDLERSYRVPGGPFLMPLIGVGVCVLLLSQAAMAEFVFSGIVVIVGAVLAAISMWVDRRVKRA